MQVFKTANLKQVFVIFFENFFYKKKRLSKTILAIFKYPKNYSMTNILFHISFSQKVLKFGTFFGKSKIPRIVSKKVG